MSRQTHIASHNASLNQTPQEHPTRWNGINIGTHRAYFRISWKNTARKQINHLQHTWAQERVLVVTRAISRRSL